MLAIAEARPLPRFGDLASFLGEMPMIVMARYGVGLAVAALSASAVLAQELLPPAVGLTVVYRFTRADGSSAQADHTYRVVSVDGLRSTAEITRPDMPTFRGALDSYRVWYSVRTVQAQGTFHQESPTAMIDELAHLRVGAVRVFPAKLRFENSAPSNGTAPGPATSDVTMTYAVEARERVSVPAGTFDAFLLRRTQDFAGPDGQPARRDTNRVWYVPELRWWVKLEFKAEVPEQPAITAVAIEITRP
jgi:hypothetical protein